MRLRPFALLLGLPLCCAGQQTLQQLVAAGSLTAGSSPFHARLAIGTAPSPYSGSVEVWWSSPTRNRVVVAMPGFQETDIQNGEAFQQDVTGDFLPRWLQDFRLALLDPAALAPPFQAGSLTGSDSRNTSCFRRDDRPNGITNQMTWGNLCVAGKPSHLVSVLTFNHSMEFSDFGKYEGRQIARAYKTDVEGYEPVTAKLSVLEPLGNAPADLFTVTRPTPVAERLQTAFLPTVKAESLVAFTPEIEWPTVREGRTEGYMIVYVRTDRTGQVRESAKRNSDQPGLEDFGIEQALRYRFRPIAVSGVREQMETPLVLHFTSHVSDPLPVLDVQAMRRQIISCPAAAMTSAAGGPPTTVTLQVSVNAAGETAGAAIHGTKASPEAIVRAFAAAQRCRFKQYAVDGKPTYFKGDVEIMVP